eukprot:5527955-Prymnesium_polylepis.1
MPRTQVRLVVNDIEVDAVAVAAVGWLEGSLQVKAENRLAFGPVGLGRHRGHVGAHRDVVVARPVRHLLEPLGG